MKKAKKLLIAASFLVTLSGLGTSSACCPTPGHIPVNHCDVYILRLSQGEVVGVERQPRQDGKQPTLVDHLTCPQELLT